MMTSGGAAGVSSSSASSASTVASSNGVGGGSSSVTIPPPPSTEEVGSKRTMSSAEDDLRSDISGGDQQQKKARTSEPPSPSKVVHVRGLSPEVTAEELKAVLCAFGHVVSLLQVKNKGQAFVEMESVAASTALVNYYASVPLQLHGQNVYFQFSKRSEVTQPNTVQGDNTILLVSVLNMMYPITIDVLHRVFKKYGSISKIVIFTKSAGFQALIEFEDPTAASVARQALNGQNIYAGCCTLRIQFSKQDSLVIKYNNEKSRDFTDPSLPSGPSGGGAYGSVPDLPLGGSALGAYGATSLGMPAAASAVGGYSGAYGQSAYGGGVYPGMYAPAARTPGGAIPGAPPSVVGMPGAQGIGSPCLIVSGLNNERITPDILFTLFGVYGDVIRVKILFNKQDTALLQFATAAQAETAMTYLNGCPLHGSVLKVNRSKYQQVNLGRVGAEASGLTKEYIGSQLHRFKRAGSKNYLNICPPNKVLHFSNLPPAITEEELRALIQPHAQVAAFKFLGSNKVGNKMGLVQCTELADAIHVLVNLHNYSLSGNYLRISFSKSAQI